MQVNNQTNISTTSIPSETPPLTLKEGEVVQATVKEQLPNNEAILQVKGQEVKVKVQGSIPANGRISIEITNTNEPIPTVKQIPIQTKNPSITEGLNLSQETKAVLKKAIDILMKNQVPVSKGAINQLVTFFEKGKGTVEQKLETISAMAKKGLEFTPVQIKSVHEALHGQVKLSDLLNEIIPERASTGTVKILKEDGNYNTLPIRGIQLSENVQKLLAQVKQLMEVAGHRVTEGMQALGKEQVLIQTIKGLLQKGESIENIVRLLKESSIPENVQKLFVQANQLNMAAGQKLTEALQAMGTDQELITSAKELLQKAGSVESIVQNVSTGQALEEKDATPNVDAAIKALKKEPSIQKVITLIQDDVIDDLQPDQNERLQISLSKAEKLTESGRELAARQELMGALDQIKKESTPEIHVPKETYQLNDDFIASLPIQSKDFIVTKITEKLSQMAIDFKHIKRDITRNLQTVQNLLDQHKQLAAPQAKPLLEATIKQLDQAILKSDMMLYTDMDTEKKFLKASSQLAEAKTLLEKGDHTQASKIVHDVKNTIDKLIFKPSDIRMQHFVSKQLLQFEQPAPSQHLAHLMESSMQATRDVATGRQMFEHLRNIGTTYEADQAHYLVSKGQEEATNSAKNALLKLVQSNQDQAMALKAEQALTQITGQQLLSKTDSSTLQSMMFTIPFLLQNQAEQVKVFVNAKNEQQKVDWENCNLYFLVETRKLGDVGIMLSAVERTLSVTLKNDKPDFKEKIEPIALMAKERLKEIGYNIGSIQFTRFTEEKGVEQVKKYAPNPSVVKLNGRGYDYSV